MTNPTGGRSTGSTPTPSSTERMMALVSAETPPEDTELSPEEQEEPLEESEEPVEGSDDPPEGTDAPLAEPDAGLHTVTVDGKDERVTLDELKRGYSREAVFTQRSQKLAEERQHFEGERVAVHQERQQYGTLLQQLAMAVQMAAGPEPDWTTLRAADPAEYAAKLAEHSQRQEQLRQIQAEQQRLTMQQQAEYQAQREAHVASEQRRLMEVMPELRDSQKGPALQRDLGQYALSLGFRPEELAEVTDHRAIVLLRKAMQYDRLQQQRPTARQAAGKAPVVTPGAAQRPKPPTSKVDDARKQLRKTGRVEDAAAFFLTELQRNKR